MTRILLSLLAILGVAMAAPAEAQLGGRIVLYTSQPDRDAARTVEAFKAVHPGIGVEVFRSGTTEIMNKLQAEIAAGDPQPDVLLIADAVSMEKLKADGRLLAHTGADVSQIPAEAYDRDRTYFGTKLITTGIIYNRAAPIRPRAWTDLLKPEAKGQITMPSPLYSGAAAIHMAAILGQPALGKAFYEGLASQGAAPVRGNGAVITAVAGGQKMYGVVVEFMALNAKAKGSPVEFVFPAEGVSAVTEPVAALRSAKNPMAARAFIDFILSKPGQELAAAQGYLPARKDVAPPAGFPNLADVKLIPIDIAAAIREDQNSKKMFADLFGG